MMGLSRNSGAISKKSVGLVPQLATPSRMVEALGLGIRGKNFVPGSVSGWIGRATGGAGILRDLGLKG